MMRESEQNQRMKSQGDLVPDRKAPLSSLTNTNSNIPLMNLTPTPVSNTSSTLLKDLTSSLFDPNAPSIQMSQPFYGSGMSTSQTMPSLLRPTTQQPPRPPMNFSSSTNKTDLTASLLNNINSLGNRPPMNSSSVPMNAMNTNSFFNANQTNNSPLFQPPPPPGSTIIKGSTNTIQTKSAASELDDLFN